MQQKANLARDRELSYLANIMTESGKHGVVHAGREVYHSCNDMCRLMRICSMVWAMQQMASPVRGKAAGCRGGFTETAPAGSRARTRQRTGSLTAEPCSRSSIQSLQSQKGHQLSCKAQVSLHLPSVGMTLTILPCPLLSPI